MKIFITFCLNFLLLHTLISQNTAEQEGFKNKLSNTTQKNTYEQFLKAINEQHWALPANASAVYYKNLLEDNKLEESLAKSFRKQWISAFQLLINQFINNRILPNPLINWTKFS